MAWPPSVIERILRSAVAELATANSAHAVADVVARAVASFREPGAQREVRIRVPGSSSMPTEAESGPGRPPLVPIEVTVPDSDRRVGALLVDPSTAARSELRVPLEILSVQAAQTLEKLQLADEVKRYQSRMEIGTLVEQTAEVILVLDEDNHIRYASPSAHRVFGTSALHDVDLLALLDSQQRPSAEFLLHHVREGESSPDVQTADWTVLTLDGRKLVVEVTVRDLRMEDSVRGLVITLRDMTAQRELEHQLIERMVTDPLTGLANRVLFADQVDHAIAANAGLTAVLLVDLDDFKSVNDHFGYSVGDEVLKTVGRRLAEAIGEGGLAARFGDDEFAALIPAVDRDAVDVMAARVADALCAPLRTSDGALVACSASVGVATTALAGTRHDLLRNANLALHAAKAASAGQWRLYHPSMTERMKYQSELRSALALALHDGSLFLEYQPIVALDSGRTVGFEALVRWRHKARGRLSPEEFIDIAEESGLIVPLGEWVLATAMNTAVRWQRAMPSDAPFVSVNVSALQFRSGGFVDAVRRLLVETGLPAGRLVLEITESSVLRDDDKVWEALRLVRSWGARVAIDDFGTGYSSLGYLRQIPLDVVKLDRLFISTSTTSERQRELLEGIVTLTRTLNLDVVAEGIETEHQRQISKSSGCGYGQGYLFSRPMSAEDTLEWLSKQHEIAQT